MSKRLHADRLTRMQRQSIVRNLYLHANLIFQQKLIEKIERRQRELELEKKSPVEIDEYGQKMRQYRSEWVERCQRIESSFIELISHDGQDQVDDQKFFKLLEGLGFKGIDHNSIFERELLQGYFEECDPDANTESEFSIENSQELRDEEREEQSELEKGQEGEEAIIESQVKKELV